MILKKLQQENVGVGRRLLVGPTRTRQPPCRNKARTSQKPARKPIGLRGRQGGGDEAHQCRRTTDTKLPSRKADKGRHCRQKGRPRPTQGGQKPMSAPKGRRPMSAPRADKAKSKAKSALTRRTTKRRVHRNRATDPRVTNKEPQVSEARSTRRPTPTRPQGRQAKHPPARTGTVYI